ncbi:MAG: phosphonate ABC transporter ATP-binding protein [Armatimonadetes bacterium]|nr:phosphonate ABC transporter ATP-binding protein [Armatimonadota bacterium]
MGSPVRLQGVTKRFPNGVEAVRGIDLAFEPGKVTVVLGPSGAGKSTLLRLINGLESATSGTVSVGGRAVQPGNLREIRKEVGMVFQQFNLVPRLSVMANVLCGRLAYRSWVTSLFFTFPDSDFDLAHKALEQVGLQDRAWDRVDKLSGGQQQRVAIARTLVQQADVILADEPVASLDPATSEEILHLLVSAARSREATLVVNLHQVDLAVKHADRIVGVKNGAIIFERNPGEWTEEDHKALYQ